MQLKYSLLVHNSLLLIPILSHMNPLHTFQYYLFKINFNVFLLFSSKSSKSSSFTFRFSNQNSLCISFHYHKCIMVAGSIPDGVDSCA